MSRKILDTNLLEGPLFKNILLFTVPIILGRLLQLLFNAADTIVVGRFAGPRELAAVGATGSIVGLIVTFCIGISIGADVLIARSVGENDKERIGRALHTSMAMSAVLGVLAACMGIFLAKPLLKLMNTPTDILPSSVAYLRAYFLGVPSLVVYNFGAAALRAKGDSARPLYFLITAGIANVILNLILVIGFHMGALGVGIATAASQFVAATLVIICLLHEESDIKLSFRKLHFHKTETKELLRIGFPTSLQSSLFSISNMIVQASVNPFGSAVVAAYSIVSELAGFMSAGLGAFYQSMITFTSQNFGARQFGRIDRGLVISVSCVCGLGIILGGLIWIFSVPCLSVYTSDATVIRYGSIIIFYMGVFQLFNGASDTVMGCVCGLGHSFRAMLVSLFGACVLRVMWIYTVFKANPTIENLYIVYPVTWITTFIMHIISFLIVRKRIFEMNSVDVHEICD